MRQPNRDAADRVSAPPDQDAAGAALRACFLAICRLSRRARSESTSSRAFIRNGSSPPIRSIVRRAFMLMRNETLQPRVSLAMLTVWRLGRKTRFFLLLAWLTRWPLRTPFPVNSQRRDMADFLLAAVGEPVS